MMNKCLLGFVSLALLVGCSSDSDDSNKVPEVSGVFSGVTYSEASTPLKVTATVIDLAASNSINETMVTLWDERDQQLSYSGVYDLGSNTLTFANGQYECTPDNNLWLCSSAFDSFTLAKITQEALSADTLLGSYRAQVESESYQLAIAAEDTMTISGASCEAKGTISYELNEQVLMFELDNNDCGLDKMTGIISYVVDNTELYSLEIQTTNTGFPLTWVKQ